MSENPEYSELDDIQPFVIPADDLEVVRRAKEEEEYLYQFFELSDIQPFEIPSSGSKASELAKEEEAQMYSPQQQMEQAAADDAREAVNERIQNREERQKYARYLFTLICCWLIGVYFLILLSGFKESRANIRTRFHFPLPPSTHTISLAPKFNWSDTVLLALIGGTTVNVLGLFVIVANYLFSIQKYSARSEKKEQKD